MGGDLGERRPFDLLDKRWIYRMVATLLGISGVLNLAWLGLEREGGAARLLIAVSVLAIAAVIALVLARPPRDVRRFVSAALLGCGVLVTAQAAVAGPTTSPFALYYVWLAPIALLVWEPRRATAYVLALAGAFAGVLAFHATDSEHFLTRDLPALVLGMGGVATVGWTMRAVCRQLVRRHADAERAARAHHGLTAFARHALAHPDDDACMTDRAAAFIAETLGADRVELRGDDVEVVRPGRPLDDDEQMFVRGVTDVLALALAREAAEQRRRDELGRDALTGLPGRERFAQHLGDVVAAGGTLMLLDVEDFGFVNETLGPHAGDAVLTGVASRLAGVLPPHALLARVGGDELALFDPGTTGEMAAMQLAGRLQTAVTAPVDLGDAQHHATLSIGIVVCAPDAYDGARDPMRDAHVAQRRAREVGRGRHELFDPATATGEALEHRRRLEQELRDGVERHEFRLVYQPVVELDSGRIVGAETLVRWQHPTRGLVGPGEFIEAAEASDLIGPLGSWILREACRQLKAWRESSPDFDDFRLAVNLSGRQLADAGFVPSVRRLLDRYEIDGRSLVFELTETALAAESGQVSDAVAELRELGIRLALDDFGTGYASISYVRRFAFDTLKLDRSFVGGLGRSEEDAALINAAISMGGALNMHIVAEGVETEEQADALRELGCGLAQGFLYSRPVGASAIRNMMRRNAGVPSVAAPLA